MKPSVVARCLLAAVLVAAPAAQGDVEEEEEEPTALDVVEQAVSEQVRMTAARLDAFFGDVRFIDENNETEIRVGAGIALEERQSPDLLTRLRGTIRLPLAERRLSLFLGGRDDIGLPAERVPALLEDERVRDDRSIGVRLSVRQAEAESLSLSTGLRFNSGRPEVFAGPRYRRSWFGERWAVTPTLGVRWFSDDGFRASAEVDLEAAPVDLTLLRLTPGIDWNESRAGFGYGIAANAFRQIDERRVVGAFVTTRFRSTRPSGLDVASIGFRYRQMWLRDWIFFDLKPAVLFRDSNDLEPVGRIEARLEIVFGGPRRAGER